MSRTAFAIPPYRSLIASLRVLIVGSVLAGGGSGTVTK